MVPTFNATLGSFLCNFVVQLDANCVLLLL